MVRLWLKKPLEKHAVHAARPSLRFTRQERPARVPGAEECPFSSSLEPAASDRGVQLPGSTPLGLLQPGCDLPINGSSENLVSWPVPWCRCYWEPFVCLHAPDHGELTPLQLSEPAAGGLSLG